ncbi:hypothetical protein FRUB_09545 [Fimbriiglobus ruber]|uniref:Uncharacterized protein n=1 Tax=Fimbriiglobus ruber TaxID=1908690 RepID=A0A225D194_9BACT|nr:hypothetical protein FRUB_09545 [Fimbriiglobus ruber]
MGGAEDLEHGGLLKSERVIRKGHEAWGAAGRFEAPSPGCRIEAG